MEYPSEIRAIVREAVKRHKDSKAQCRTAARRIRAHAEFGSFVDCLVDGAIQELVSDVRRSLNRKMRSVNSVLPKVNRGNSPYYGQSPTTCTSTTSAGTCWAI